VVRRQGVVDYLPTWQAMQAFTAARTAHTADEIWLVEHPSVYTLGLAGKPEHVLDAGDIPVVKTDRGGQVTYHGPGQVIAYLLIDLHRRGLKVRELVSLMEDAVIRLLAGYGIEGARQEGAPGVYVAGAKIAALGLRVRQGRSYHGVSLNVNMGLAPFTGINPCGYSGMKVTQLADLGVAQAPPEVAEKLLEELIAVLEAPRQESAQ
jgi:lipoyl(octanoyl) transferase